MEQSQHWRVTAETARKALESTFFPFVEILKHGSMLVEFYRPDKVDLQQPHTRDELYFILKGTGQFSKNGEKVDFQPGDVLFVEAGAEHRFENFSDDFETWVVFWGPEGGESA
jgi:mannose-6-phosphate isomerase-like protein (cupin superfamily)